MELLLKWGNIDLLKSKPINVVKKQALALFLDYISSNCWSRFAIRLFGSFLLLYFAIAKNIRTLDAF